MATAALGIIAGLALMAATWFAYLWNHEVNGRPRKLWEAAERERVLRERVKLLETDVAVVSAKLSALGQGAHKAELVKMVDQASAAALAAEQYIDALYDRAEQAEQALGLKEHTLTDEVRYHSARVGSARVDLARLRREVEHG